MPERAPLTLKFRIKSLARRFFPPFPSPSLFILSPLLLSWGSWKLPPFFFRLGQLTVTVFLSHVQLFPRTLFDDQLGNWIGWSLWELIKKKRMPYPNMLTLKNHLRSSVFNDLLCDRGDHLSSVWAHDCIVFPHYPLSRDEVNDSHDKSKYLGTKNTCCFSNIL